ncbi:GroES-like protein [Microthyrium microscopicum]|uniref:GroES-like protein n=1 Tax=Microthyrium microscopicum TaxID=703497 RepID=A0A6A6USG2_9PEZI|nr:GroES-like protein [Microthyrium microscopicum]
MKGYSFAEMGPVSENLKLEDIETPKPGPDETLVRIIAAAINPSDVKNVMGAFPHTTLPRVPGRDFAGIVEGGENDGLHVWGTGGDNGFHRNGSHAQYIVVPTAGLSEKPKNISFSQAASCGVGFLTADSMISRAGVGNGQFVLVLGSSGAVGGSAVQILKRLGATPIESARAEKQGAVNTTAESLVPQTDSLTNGAGVDVVLDTVSDPALFKKALSTLKNRGKYVIITAPRSAERQLSFDALELYRADRTLIGVNSLNITFLESMELMSSLKVGFEDGYLSAPPVSAIQEVGYENEREVVEAYEAVGKGAKGKYILKFCSE